MSIRKEGNKYVLQCDYCSNYVDDFDDFMDAVIHKKASKWESVHIKDEWFDKCPDCIGGDQE